MIRGGLRDPASSEPDDHDPTFEGYATARAVEYISAYGVEDHVRATTLRRPLDDLDEVLLPIVYGYLRTELLANADLLAAFAIWMAAEPTPPAPACTSTVSPDSSCALWCRATWLVW